MGYTTDTTYDGIREREFTVRDIPGVLWTPVSAGEHTPLVLLGHGGGLDRKSPPMTGRARRLVAAGLACVCIDAPGHGSRPRTAEDSRDILLMRQARADGSSVGPLVVRYNSRLAERAVPEWQLTIDALADEEFGPIGYAGVALGTAIGVPLAAVDPRITAAAFGLCWPDNLLAPARQITVPVQYAMQWDDELISRHAALALFDAFGSAEKSLHANPGRHGDFPPHEVESSVRFLLRHLG
jgi:dienelactone hydrolase